MQYAQISDLTTRYDTRRLGDLISDNDTRQSPTGSPILNALLLDASGLIDAACQRGQRYTPTDLLNISNGADPLDPTLDMTGSQALLRRLVCDLAYGMLVGRRGFSGVDTDSQAARYKEAVATLELLKTGEWVFVTAGSLAAGLPQTGVVISQQINLISGIRRTFGDLGVGTNNFPPQNPGLFG